MAHTVEVAKSGRATCRGCRNKIEKGVVRFGEEVPNMFSEEGGTTFRWWHLECGAKGKLANEVRDALKSFAGEVPNRDALDKLIQDNLHADYPYAEHAPNARARCRVCDESLEKGVLRVAFERTVETGMGIQRGPGYMHSTCTFGYPDALALKDTLVETLRAHSTKLSDADKDQLAADVAKSVDKIKEPEEGSDDE